MTHFTLAEQLARQQAEQRYQQEQRYFLALLRTAEMNRRQALENSDEDE